DVQREKIHPRMSQISQAKKQHSQSAKSAKSVDVFFFALLRAFAAHLIFIQGSAVAQTPAPSLQFTQSTQQSLQLRAHEIQSEITSILDEFDRNKLSDLPDVKTLRSVRAILTNCSESDMKKVVEFLSSARQTQAESDSRRLASSAYAVQKSILTQLEQ